MAIACAHAKGMCIANTRDDLTGATANSPLLLMLGAARGAIWGDRMVREDKWLPPKPTFPLGHDVSGRRLGIYGMGRIGQAVAKRAAAFGMTLHYHNRKPVAAELSHGATYHPTLDGMLPHSDFLSINCASTAETRDSINERAIGLLPQHGHIVFCGEDITRHEIEDRVALGLSLVPEHRALFGAMPRTRLAPELQIAQ